MEKWNIGMMIVNLTKDRHSGESRNPVISTGYEDTGHRFLPQDR